MEELIQQAGDYQPVATEPTGAETPAIQPEEPQQPEPPNEFRLPTGEVYRGVDALLQGATEKENFIRTLKEERRAEREFLQQILAQTRQGQQAPQTDPTIENEVARLVPEMQRIGFEGEAAVEMARFQVQRERTLFQQAQTAVQQQFAAQQAQQNMARYEQIKAQDPRFNHETNPVAMGVIAANPGLTPDQHYALMQQAYQQLGIPTGQQAQAQGVQPIQPSWQQQRQSQFANAGQGGAQNTARGALPPVIQQSLDAWKAQYPHKAADPAVLADRTQSLIAEYNARTGGAF